MTDEAKALGARLARARLNAGLSIRLAAAGVGMAHPRIVEIEKGRRKVSALELATLARLYGVPMTTLLEPNPPVVDVPAPLPLGGHASPLLQSASE